MQTIICPIDGTPCAPDCPDRFHDREEGGCLLTMISEHCNAALIIGVNTLEEEGDDP